MSKLTAKLEKAADKDTAWEEAWELIFEAIEEIKELEKRIEAARIIIDSQSFWCDLANKECVGMKSIVHLVENALEE